MVLEYIKKYFRWIGLLYWDSTAKGKLVSIIINLAFIAIWTGQFSAVLLDFVLNSTTFSEGTESVLFMSGGMLMILWYIASLFERNNYASLLSKLDDIIETSRFSQFVQIAVL